MPIREAEAKDVERCIHIRANTRENAITKLALKKMGITAESWMAAVDSGRTVGFVSTVGDEIVGHCFGDCASGEVLVLAILPGHEGNGMGKKLLQCVCESLRSYGHSRVWLGASSDNSTRAYGFYRHLGWSPTGQTDSRGDEMLARYLVSE